MSFSGLPENKVTGTIENDGFWPALDLGKFQSEYRIPAEFAKAMVEEHIRLAMLRTNSQLKIWKAEQRAAGHNSLADVPGEMLGDTSEYQILYRRAVFCHAKALLMKQFATVNRRAGANNDAKESDETEDKFMEFARDAIADFTGQSRIGVHDL